MTRRPGFWMTSTSSLAGVTVRVEPRQIRRSDCLACSKARFRISSSKLSPKLMIVSLRKPLQSYMKSFEDYIAQTTHNNCQQCQLYWFKKIWIPVHQRKDIIYVTWTNNASAGVWTWVQTPDQRVNPQARASNVPRQGKRRPWLFRSANTCGAKYWRQSLSS